MSVAASRTAVDATGLWSEHGSQILATVPNEVVELLGTVADLGGPTDPIEAIQEGLKLLVDERRKQKRKGTYAKGRKILARTKSAVDARDGDPCTFIGPDGGRCSQTRNLQYDHATPVALGPTRADDPDGFRSCARCTSALRPNGS